MKIREASISDLRDVLFVERAAFDREDEADLVRDLFEDASARPLLSLLAYEGQQPLGHILFTRARLRDAPREVAISLLAPLAVVPALMDIARPSLRVATRSLSAAWARIHRRVPPWRRRSRTSENPSSRPD